MKYCSSSTRLFTIVCVVLLSVVIVQAATDTENTQVPDKKLRVSVLNGKEWISQDISIRTAKEAIYISFDNGPFEEVEAVERLSAQNLQNLQLDVRFQEVNAHGNSPARSEDVSLINLQEEQGIREDLSTKELEELEGALPDITLKLEGDDNYRYVRLPQTEVRNVLLILKPIWLRTTAPQTYFAYRAASEEIWDGLKGKYPYLVSVGVRYVPDLERNNTFKLFYIGIDLLWDVSKQEIDYVKTRDLVRQDAVKLLTAASLPSDRVSVSWVGAGEPLINRNEFLKEKEAGATRSRFDPTKYGGLLDGPMQGGANVGFKGSTSGMGTLGGFLIRHPAVGSDDAYDLFGVSNAHVWRSAVGTDTCQPSEALWKLEKPTGLGNRQCEGIMNSANTCCQKMGKITAHRVNMPQSPLNNLYNSTNAPANLNGNNNGMAWPTSAANMWSNAPTLTNPNPTVTTNPNAANSFDPTRYVRDFAAVKLDYAERYKFRCAVKDIGAISGASRYSEYLRRTSTSVLGGSEYEFHEPLYSGFTLFMNDVLKFGARTHVTGGRMFDYFPRSQTADMTVVGRRSAVNPRGYPISFAPNQIYTDPLFHGSVVGNGDVQFMKDVRDHFVKTAPLPQFSVDPDIDLINRTTLFYEMWSAGRIMSAFAFSGDSGAFVMTGSDVLGQVFETVWVEARPDDEIGMPGRGIEHLFPCFKGGCPAMGLPVIRESLDGRVEFFGFFMKTRVASISFVVDEVNEALRINEGKNFAPLSLCNEADRIGYTFGRTDAHCFIVGSKQNRRCGPRPICRWVLNQQNLYECKARTDL